MDLSFILALLLFYISLISFSLVLYNLLKKVKRAEEIAQDPQSKTSIPTLKLSDKTLSAHHLNATHLPQSILLELFCSVKVNGSDGSKGLNEEGNESGINEKSTNKKKKKRKVKNKEEISDLIVRNESDGKRKDMVLLKSNSDEELVCLYPFTSSSSATQRKIKQQYDELVTSQKSKGLTLAQVGQFVNCLVDARNELQIKSECIRRKFTITKALLLTANRSSLDRLGKQIYKLEMEQKRLEEDAFVYNRLQHQLKLSPAYKKMLEISALTEVKDKSNELVENQELEENNISFEEFLEQEKKDVFWQKYGKQNHVQRDRV